MHIEPVTIVWDVVALAGVVFSVSVIPQYWVARTAARVLKGRMTDQTRRDAVRLIRDYLWSEVSRLICHAISLTLGVWSIFVPRVPPVDRPPAVEIFGLAFLVGIILINCLTVSNSIRAYLSWRRRSG